MTNKHPRDGGVALSLSLSLGVENINNDRAIKKQHRRDGEFVCKTCSRAFATFQALGGHRTSHLRGRHGLALGLAAASSSSPANKAAAATAANKEEEKPAAAASHQCHFCGAEFEMGQALGGHMRRHRDAAAATVAQAPPVLLQLFV
ncbi:hypothetical protein PR202_gb10459 [Eleusine coracana subsp. coracana]|uniref:C2H2-type domain-containing protein n=1 Tax=Eleusine coracana subsp. coracana TaxID=191504 RepID=A0AAV5EK11_ELECO|nr:hypothetical protein QOZ80_3BG0255620 [Eleusine coracana subsp. coracana]GJN22857.1 hypothetical protein PR202_gb10459 [Eleusine coracana subsp. coracana]